MTGPPVLATVIPARNEGPRLAAVLSSLAPSIPGISKNRVIVVDDGSTDRTAEVARRAGATVLRHRVNLGKGSALLTGCEAARLLRADLIVTMDADGQHAATDLPALVEPLLQGDFDMVLGARQFSRQMPAVFRLGNHVLNVTLRAFYGVAVSDSQCGFRAFRTEVFPALRWHAADYAVESEMLMRMARARLRYVEVPVSTVYLDRYKGTQPLDGLRILRQVIGWRLGILR